jgi:uncharacterized protein YndB with AHSA1/START domain
VPTTVRTRTVPAPPEVVWEIVADAHHMPRWWPGVLRMEGVAETRFTQVFTTKRGRPVRIDFSVISSDPPRVRAWAQEIPGTPFERVLTASIVTVQLAPEADATLVTLTQEQKLRGYSRTGGFLLRRATRERLDDALAGLAGLF